MVLRMICEGMICIILNGSATRELKFFSKETIFKKFGEDVCVNENVVGLNRVN